MWNSGEHQKQVQTLVWKSLFGMAEQMNEKIFWFNFYFEKSRLCRFVLERVQQLFQGAKMQRLDKKLTQQHLLENWYNEKLETFVEKFSKTHKKIIDWLLIQQINNTRAFSLSSQAHIELTKLSLSASNTSLKILTLYWFSSSRL